jgi:Tol biopolymer transport system component
VFLRRQGEESLPSWSPDGKTLYFATDDGDGGSYLVDPDGTNLRRIPGAGIGAARWSPDGSWLITTGSDGKGIAVIAERVDGTERHSLTPGVTLVGSSAPSWSRDGRLAFTRTNAADDSTNIWIANADGTGLSQLTTGDFDEFPVWSPDGKFVAFTAAEPIGPSSNVELHVVVVNADGSGRRVLTTSAQSSANAVDAWSPDGRWLLYRRWNTVNGLSGCSYYKIPSSGGTPIPLLATAPRGACLGATWR